MPVVRDAGEQAPARARGELRRPRAARPHAKRLTADDLTGGTFTITNVGGYGTLVTGADHQPAPGGDPVDRRRDDAAGGACRDRTASGRIAVHPVGNLAPVASTTGRSTAPTPSAFLAAGARASSRPATGRRGGLSDRRRAARQPYRGYPGRRADRRLPAARASRGRSTTARSACRSRAGCSSRSPAPGTRRCCSALARHLRPGLRLVLPLLPRPGARARPRRHADRDPAAGGRLGRRSRRRAAARCRRHWGNARAQHRHPVEPHRQPVPPRGRLRRGGALHRAPAAPARAARPTATSSPTCRSARARRSEGEFWESLNTACTPAPARALRRAPTTATRSRCRSTDQHPAPIAELVRGFRGLDVAPIDGRDYFDVRERGARRSSSTSAPASGPALDPRRRRRGRTRTRAADTQSKYRSADELADEARARPDRPCCERRPRRRGGVLTPSEAADACGPRRRRRWPTPRPRRSPPRRPDPATVTDHVVRAARRRRPAEPPCRRTASRSPFGEAIRRTLHEQMAADERIRVFGEDVADAREARARRRRGQGRRVRHHARPAARVRPGPLLQHAARRRRTSSAGPSARRIRGLRPCARDPVLRLHLAGHDTRSRARRPPSAGARTARSPCPMVVRVPIGGYLTGGAIWHSQCGESIFAHVPGLLIAFPSRARDAAGLLRAAFRCEDPVLFLEHKHLLRQPYTVDPFPPADYVLPFGVGDVRRPGDDLTIVTWGATVEKSLAGGGRGAAEPTASRSRSSTCARSSPWDHDLVAESRAPAPAGCSSCTRTCSPPASAPRSRRGRRRSVERPRRPGPPGGRARHPRRLRADARARDPPAGRRHRRRARSDAPLTGPVG